MKKTFLGLGLLLMSGCQMMQKEAVTGPSHHQPETTVISNDDKIYLPIRLRRNNTQTQPTYGIDNDNNLDALLRKSNMIGHRHMDDEINALNDADKHQSPVVDDNKTKNTPPALPPLKTSDVPIAMKLNIDKAPANDVQMEDLTSGEKTTVIAAEKPLPIKVPALNPKRIQAINMNLLASGIHKPGE